MPDYVNNVDVSLPRPKLRRTRSAICGLMWFLSNPIAKTNVVVCSHLSGKERHTQVSMGAVVTSGSLANCKIDTCCSLALPSSLIGEGKGRFTQCLDNVSHRNIRSWCRRPDFPVRQHSEVSMSVHCHKSVLILI